MLTLVGVAALFLGLVVGTNRSGRVAGGAYLLFVAGLPVLQWLADREGDGVEPHFVAIGVGTALVLAGSRATLGRLPEAMRHPTVRWLAAFLCWAYLSVLWSELAALGQTRLDGLLVRGVVPGIALLLLAAARPVVGRFSIAVSVVVLSGVTLLFSSDSTGARRSLEGVNPIWLARSLVLSAIIVAFAPGVRLRWRVAAVVPLVVAAVSTEERGPVLGLLFGLALATLGRRFTATGELRSRAPLVLGMLLAVAAVGVFAVNTGERFADLDQQIEEGDSSVESRIELWENAIDVWFDAPLAGVGAGGYQARTGFPYPHNLFLETLSELGLVGVVLLAGLLISAVRTAFRVDWLWPALPTALVFASFSGHFGNNFEWVLVILGLVGFDLATRQGSAATGARSDADVLSR